MLCLMSCKRVSACMQICFCPPHTNTQETTTTACKKKKSTPTPPTPNTNKNRKSSMKTKKLRAVRIPQCYQEGDSSSSDETNNPNKAGTVRCKRMNGNQRSPPCNTRKIKGRPPPAVTAYDSQSSCFAYLYDGCNSTLCMLLLLRHCVQEYQA